MAIMQVMIDGHEPQDADDLVISFKDLNDAEYELRLSSRHSDTLGAETLDIDLTYPGGNMVGMESITLTPFAEDEED